MEKFDCNLKCPFFLHINFPMVRNCQKLWYFSRNEIFKIMTYSGKGMCLRDPKCILVIHCSFVISIFFTTSLGLDVKYAIIVIYHKWKVPGENVLLLTSRTCRFIFYFELSNLLTVNNTIFCLIWFLSINYGQ